MMPSMKLRDGASGLSPGVFASGTLSAIAVSSGCGSERSWFAWCWPLQPALRMLSQRPVDAGEAAVAAEEGERVVRAEPDLAAGRGDPQYLAQRSGLCAFGLGQRFRRGLQCVVGERLRARDRGPQFPEHSGERRNDR